MITFRKDDKRKYSILLNDNSICTLNLVFNPATNKADKVISFIEDCSVKLGDEFNNWFSSFLIDYQESNYEYAVVKRNVPELMRLADKYLELCNVDFEDYIDRDKASKNSIFYSKNQ